MSVEGSPALNALCARAWDELMLRQMREVGPEPAAPPVRYCADRNASDRRAARAAQAVGRPRRISKARVRKAPRRSDRPEAEGYVPSWAEPRK